MIAPNRRGDLLDLALSGESAGVLTAGGQNLLVLKPVISARAVLLLRARSVRQADRLIGELVAGLNIGEYSLSLKR